MLNETHVPCSRVDVIVNQRVKQVDVAQIFIATNKGF